MQTMKRERTPNLTIEQWCKKQEQLEEHSDKLKFTDLLREFEDRVVMFNNWAENPMEKKQQVDNLLVHVNMLQNNGERYTNKIFKEMDKERQKLILKSKLPQMEEGIMMNATWSRMI